MTLLAGVAIGGTKCAVCVGEASVDEVAILRREEFPTPPGPRHTIQALLAALEALLVDLPAGSLQAIGIACGGPLDSRRGIVLSPPNLPGWDEIDILTPFRRYFRVSVAVQNDANAGALAEWRWGAGRGTRNMIFLTMGTGMGGGLILDGRLYSGTNDLAGEVGHLRLAEAGPVGFGKAGSFEGFCSGGGIALLARALAQKAIAAGKPPLYCPTEADLPQVTAKSVAEAAHLGDPLAREVWEIVARRLGQGLAILVDVLNPERIVIGSIFGRQQALLEPLMWEVLRQEAIPLSLAVCQVVPAALGEAIGDYEGLAVALDLLDKP